jgi:hypothetical protein
MPRAGSTAMHSKQQQLQIEKANLLLGYSLTKELIFMLKADCTAMHSK